jgi:lipopolysaccharide export system protein LptA
VRRISLAALAAAACLAAAAPAAAQEAVDVAADRLIGSRGPEGEIVLLEGNVVLRRGTTVIKSQQGRWVKSQQRVQLLGGVEGEDGTLRIRAAEAVYQEDADLLTASGDVRITDRDLEARADFGSYDAGRRIAELWGNVQGQERGRRLRAQRVTYERDTERTAARGAVWATDSSGTLVLTASAVDYDRRLPRTRAFGAPKLVRREDDREITLTGDTLTLDPDGRIAWADGNVKIERDTLRAEAGHAVWWDREERGVLTGAPVARYGEVIARGDTIELFARGEDLQRVVVRDSARIEFVSREEETRGERNQLAADRIHLFFDGDDLDSLQAVGGAENLYIGVPRSGRVPEENHALGQRIAVYFDDGHVERAVLTGGPSGRYRFEHDSADTVRGGEVVVYRGDRIEYLVRDRRILIENGARLDFRNVQLSASRVEFDSRKETLVARGDPVLKDREEQLSGRTMTYDLETERGTIYHAATRYDDGLYRGNAIQRIDDDELRVRGGEYTTCDLAEPHYHIAADRMKILLRDKIVARPLVFYLKQIPLFALPFYVLPIQSDRHSGFLFPQIQFGFSGESGRFLRNLGYYWAPNDYSDFTLSGDYYEKEPSWVLRGDARYRWLDRIAGDAHVRYIGSDAFLGSEQYEVKLDHAQTLDTRTRLTAQGSFTSSRDFTRDPRTGEPLQNRLDRFLVSSLALNRRFPFGTANLALSRRQDLDAAPVISPLPRLTEDLPIFSLAFLQRPIGRAQSSTRAAFLPALSSVYANYTLRVVNRSQTFRLFAGLDTTSNTILLRDSTATVRGVGGSGGLADTRRLAGFLTWNTFFNSTQVLFEEDLLGQRWQPAASYNIGTGSSATFYGTFRPHLGAVQGIRHILFPQISYSYQPEFESLTYTDSLGITRSRFPSVGGVSISGFRQSLLSYSLQNRFQVRLRRGEEVRDLPNLLTVVTSGQYDFLWRDRGYETPWRPIATTIRLQPPAYFSLSGTLNHSFDHKPYFRSVSFAGDLRLSGASGPTSPVAETPLDGNEALSRGDATPSGPWSLSLTYSYAAGRNFLNEWGVNQTGNAYASFQPAPNWHLDYYNTVDLDLGQIVAQEFAVVRDLHCWQARFVRRFTSGGESEYYFRFSLRTKPELYYERGARGLGSFGGL